MWYWIIILLLVVYLVNTTQVEQTGGFHRQSLINVNDCPVRPRNRWADRCQLSATSNGTLNWLVNHPAYYYESYHGYFPWAEDDYNRFLPFE